MKPRRWATVLTLPLTLATLAGCESGNKVAKDAAADITAASSQPSEPASTSGSPAPPARACGSPVFTTSDPDGGWPTAGYYVHNNMWNQSESGPETLYACAYNNWYVDSTQPATSSVKTYPNVHKDINNLDGTPLNHYSSITSTFAGRGPGTGIYDVAYDVWLNGVGDGAGVTELMVWTENLKQVPSGSKVTTFSAGGVTYDVWKDDSDYVAFVAQTTLYSGTVDLKAMIDWAIGRGYLPGNPTVNQIGYGIEFCSTDNSRARFTLTDFSVTMS